MAALPYIQLYVAEYLADTQHLTLEEHGAYLLLIFNYWQRGKSLVDSDKRMASVCSTSVERWLTIRSTLEEFFIIKDGFWIHDRIEKDLEKVHKKSRQAQEAGKKSAEKKKKDQAVNNGRSTGVDVSLQRGDNHTDTDTEKNKEDTPLPPLPETMEIPKWIDAELWGKWKEWKREIGQSVSIFEEEVAIQQLTDFHNQGMDVSAVIRQSITNRYKGFFPVKVGEVAKQRLTPRQQQMRDIADMRNAIEERENGIDLERCSSIAGETLLALPGGGA